MLNSNLVKEAHKMAKEIKAEYPDVDYRYQYGLCLSYLLNKGEVEMEKVTKELNKTYNLITRKGIKVELTVKSVTSSSVGIATVEISKLKKNSHCEYDLVGRWQTWAKTGDKVIKFDDDRLLVVRNEKLIEDINNIRYSIMK